MIPIFRSRARRKRELEDEISAHFEMAVKDRMSRGESRRDAERAARLEFGNVDNVKEDARAAWGGIWIDRFERDIRFALRVLRKRPGFALSAILILALGIGATTAIFSVINGVLIQPLPYPESDRLIELRHQSAGDDDISSSIALYFTYREHNRSFESLALWTSGSVVVTGARQSEEVRTLDVTYEFLSTLRVQPVLGRGFSEADGQPGAPLTVVLSDAYWKRQLGGTEDAIGQSLVVDGKSYAIIGILPPSFRFLTEQVEILTLKQLTPGVGGTAMFGSFGERGIARLRAGVTLGEASADIARMLPIARDTFPPLGAEDARDGPIAFAPNLRFLKEAVVGELDDVLWILMGTIGLLFLIACANVANLQMMRTDARLEELSIRAALGARLGAITRSLLTETMLLGIAGGALGLSVAALGLPLLLSVAGEYLPSVLDISVDWTVLIFALIVSLVCGTALGLLPLMKYGVPGLTSVLRAGGRSHGQTRERHRTRHLLVTSQVALAVVLLIAAGLMMRTFQSLRSIDPGFDPSEQVQTVTIPTSSVPDFARAVRLLNEVQDRLSQLPGVESAAFVSVVPLAGIGPNSGALVEREPGVENLATFEFRFVSPGFFETIGTPRLAGRALSWNDVYEEDRPEVAVVSESFAKTQFGSPEAAIGKRMRRSPESPWIEIAGVVSDIHLESIDQPVPEAVFFTQRNEVAQYVGRTVTFVVRSERVGTPGFLDELRRAVWSVDSSLPVAGSRTLSDLYRQSMARTSLMLVLLAIMSIMALGLSLVGIYGIIGYLLSKRTREIGVRIALGAQYAGLKRLLLGQVLAPVCIGIVLGLCIAGALARLAQSLLFGVTALDPATYIVVALALLTTAGIAGYIPTRRVVHIDATEALRIE